MDVCLFTILSMLCTQGILEMKRVRLIENSWRAKLAARLMKGENMAITFGNDIHLYNTSKEYFLRNKTWLRHELKHVEQYQKLGYFRFIVLYLWYSFRYGYYNNPFELEARAAEEDTEIVSRHEINRDMA